MAEISGVLHHFGQKDRGKPFANFYATADHQGGFVIVLPDGTVKASDGIGDPGAYGFFKVQGDCCSVNSQGTVRTFAQFDVSGLPA